MPRLSESGLSLTPCDPHKFSPTKHTGTTAGHTCHLPPSWGPGGGRGLGRGAGGGPQGPSCFSWEVLNPFLLTQLWGQACRVLPNLRYVLEGCLVGLPWRLAVEGAPTQDSALPGPGLPACLRWSLNIHGGARGLVPARWRLRPAAHTPSSSRLRVWGQMSSSRAGLPHKEALLSILSLPRKDATVLGGLWGVGLAAHSGAQHREGDTHTRAHTCSYVMSTCGPVGTDMLDYAQAQPWTDAPTAAF